MMKIKRTCDITSDFIISKPFQKWKEEKEKKWLSVESLKEFLDKTRQEIERNEELVDKKFSPYYVINVIEDNLEGD